MRYLAQGQVSAVLAELIEPYQRLIALFGLEAGLRRGEILSLKVRQADPRQRMILLDGRDTKTGIGRKIPITNRLTREVISWLRANPTLRAGEWLIANPDTGKPYYETRWWNDACTRAGISGFHFHDTRHHFASNFVQRGGRLQPLARLMGHSTTAMTEKYAHLSEDTAAVGFRRVVQRALAGL